jgi:hypothetical protein
MHRRSIGFIAALSTLPLLGGCVQATRHSNTLVFGTNTSFGIKVGTDTAQVPTIIVGYDRQEAVIMPLVANTEEAADAAMNRLSPCDLTQGVRVDGDAEFAVHPCSLVATNGSAQDAYSVLASFGASYDATGTSAKGGLAQYFSTGIAAQILALKGGAALVATGEAAEASAQTPASAGLAALITGNSNYARGIAETEASIPLEKEVLKKIRATDQGNLVNSLTNFENALGISSGAVTACKGRSPSDCADLVEARDLYADSRLSTMADKVTSALAAWSTP